VRLRAPELAAIASTGQAEVRVHRPLTVALMSSGDEIIRPGTPFREGAIYDANVYILRGALEPLGVEVRDYGVIADTREAVEAAYARAVEECDVIVTSAGASQGESSRASRSASVRSEIRSFSDCLAIPWQRSSLS